MGMPGYSFSGSSSSSAKLQTNQSFDFGGIGNLSFNAKNKTADTIKTVSMTAAGVAVVALLVKRF